MDEWMTRREVAKLYRTPVGTLSQWAFKGIGPSYVRVGRKAVYRRVDVEQWIEEREQLPRERV